MDSHRWVPLPAVGFPTNSVAEENQEDVTPPSILMEHPPLAVFVNGQSCSCLRNICMLKTSSCPNLPRDFATQFCTCSGVSAAMNELRPCAPLSLKHILAQELIKQLRAVSDYLLRYHATQTLRDNESILFLSLCRAFIEVLSYWVMTAIYICMRKCSILTDIVFRLLIHIVQLASVDAIKVGLLL